MKYFMSYLVLQPSLWGNGSWLLDFNCLLAFMWLLLICISFSGLQCVTFPNVLTYFFIFKIRKKAKIRNQYNQTPRLTQDTICVCDKYTIKHHIQESQDVSPFPAGDHKAAMNRQENRTNMKHK